MVGDACDCHGHGLLDQPVALEAVTVDQRADQLPLNLGGGTSIRREIGRLSLCIRPHVGSSSIWLAGAAGTSCRLLHRSLLLSGRKGFVELSVDEEVAEYAAWTPGDSICPSLDSRSIFLVYEDASTSNEITAFSVVRSPWYMRKVPLQAGLEENQCILRGGYVALEGWLKRRSAGRHVEGFCVGSRDKLQLAQRFLGRVSGCSRFLILSKASGETDRHP